MEIAGLDAVDRALQARMLRAKSNVLSLGGGFFSGAPSSSSSFALLLELEPLARTELEPFGLDAVDRALQARMLCEKSNVLSRGGILLRYTLLFCDCSIGR